MLSTLNLNRLSYKTCLSAGRSLISDTDYTEANTVSLSANTAYSKIVCKVGYN